MTRLVPMWAATTVAVVERLAAEQAQSALFEVTT